MSPALISVQSYPQTSMTIDLTSGSQILNFTPPKFQDHLFQDYELTDPSNPQRNVQVEGLEQSKDLISECIHYSVLDNSLPQAI